MTITILDLLLCIVCLKCVQAQVQGKLSKYLIILDCLQLSLLVICLSAWSPEEGACCRLLHDISPMQADQLTEPI